MMEKLKKRIYMAGSGGMLGEAFYEVFKDDYVVRCTDKDVNDTWLSHVDFRNSINYKRDVLAFQPDYIFHLGAYTDLEFCEEFKEDTYQTNFISVITATELANELNIPLLYISTAGIFDGSKELYDDWDTPNPMGHYARSKYMAEKYVLEYANKNLICRAGWMMGGGPLKDKKFINKLIKQLVQGKRNLYIVDDRDGTPTYTIDFARNTRLLIETNSTGLYNMVCSGQTSRFDVAKELIKILKFDDDVIINKVTSDYYKKQYFAPRPTCECLVNKRLNDEGKNIMRDWKIALEEYISVKFNNYLEENLTVGKSLSNNEQK